jgi:uncharacterized membrane protein YozB (DUF420 family)
MNNKWNFIVSVFINCLIISIIATVTALNLKKYSPHAANVISDLRDIMDAVGFVMIIVAFLFNRRGNTSL